MNDDDRSRLKHIVERSAELGVEVDGYKDDINGCGKELKELATVASERLGVPAKALKQLVVEWRMGEEQRVELRQQEHKLDECRLALGLLADTPLGMAAAAHEAAHVEQQAEPKRRGRPKGSRNKPKASHPVRNANAAVEPVQGAGNGLPAANGDGVLGNTPPLIPDELIDPFVASADEAARRDLAWIDR